MATFKLYEAVFVRHGNIKQLTFMASNHKAARKLALRSASKLNAKLLRVNLV